MEGPERDFKGPRWRKPNHGRSRAKDGAREKEEGETKQWGFFFFKARVGEISSVSVDKRKKVTSRACEASAADGECASGGALRAGKKVFTVQFMCVGSVCRCLWLLFIEHFRATVNIKQWSKAAV